MRAVIISSSGDSFAVREKHTDVQVAQLAAAHRVSDVRPGSEVLCLKNASVAHFPAVVSAVGEDGTCTLMKQTSEKRSVGFGRVLEQPDPEVLRDGARVLWSPIASCKSFRPAVISSLIVALEDLAVPADRGLLEPGRRVFYRHADEHTEEEDDSGSEPTEEETTEQRESIRRRSSHCSAATVTDVNDEVVSLDVEVGWGVPFEALKAPIVPLDRHAIVVGTKVRYQYSGGGSDFWPATVTAVHDDGTCDLHYDDGDVEEEVEPRRAAPSRPPPRAAHCLLASPPPDLPAQVHQGVGDSRRGCRVTRCQGRSPCRTAVVLDLRQRGSVCPPARLRPPLPPLTPGTDPAMAW